MKKIVSFILAAAMLFACVGTFAEDNVTPGMDLSVFDEVNYDVELDEIDEFDMGNTTYYGTISCDVKEKTESLSRFKAIPHITTKFVLRAATNKKSLP